MGPEYAWLATALAAAGTGAQVVAANEEKQDRRSILNRQMEANEQATKKSVDMVEDEGQRYSQEARLAGLEQAEKKTFDQTQADLAGAGGATISTATQAGNVSDDFLKTKAARAIDEGTRLTSIAREAAKGRAPGALNLDDSLSLAGMQGDMRSMWGTTKNMARANSIDAENVEAPAYGALGSIASAAGTGMAARSMRARQGGTPPNPYNTGGIAF